MIYHYQQFVQWTKQLVITQGVLGFLLEWKVWWAVTHFKKGLYIRKKNNIHIVIQTLYRKTIFFYSIDYCSFSSYKILDKYERYQACNT